MTDVPTIVISASELDTLRQCPLKHALAYDERWTIPSRGETHPLAFGTLWHLVIQRHRERLAERAGLHGARIAVLRVLDDVQDPEVRLLLLWMYDGYVERWGADREWEPIGSELSGEVDLPPPLGWPKPEFNLRLKFKIDLLFRWQGRIWVLDEKSAKDLPKGRTDFDFDDQFGLYYWAAGQLGYPVFGAMYSGSRKTKLVRAMTLDERFARIPMHRTPVELRTVAEEAWQTAYFGYKRLWETREARQLGANNAEVGRHPNSQTCKWRCDFKEPCIAGRKGISLRSYLRSKGMIQDFSRH